MQRAFPMTPIKNEYVAVSYDEIALYVTLVGPSLEAKIFDDQIRGSVDDYHLDKSVQYHDRWAAAGLDLRRASLIYLLTYTAYFRRGDKTKSAEWVIENYELWSWVLKIIEAQEGYSDEPPNRYFRSVVTAANVLPLPDPYGELILVGARHFSPAMHNQMDIVKKLLKADENSPEFVDRFEKMLDGFIDQWDMFMTRYQAYVVARFSGQLNTRRPKSGSVHVPVLYSEDIH